VEFSKKAPEKTMTLGHRGPWLSGNGWGGKNAIVGVPLYGKRRQHKAGGFLKCGFSAPTGDFGTKGKHLFVGGTALHHHKYVKKAP